MILDNSNVITWLFFATGIVNSQNSGLLSNFTWFYGIRNVELAIWTDVSSWFFRLWWHLSRQNSRQSQALERPHFFFLKRLKTSSLSLHFHPSPWYKVPIALLTPVIRANPWTPRRSAQKDGFFFLFPIGFLKDRCLLRLSPRFKRCSPHHATSSRWALVLRSKLQEGKVLLYLDFCASQTKKCSTLRTDYPN